MTLFHYLLLCLLLSLGANCDLEHNADNLKEQCLEISENLLIRHLGTKTPYRVVRNLDFDSSKFMIEGCTPIKIVGVVRHGTRTPSVKDVNRMRDTLSKLSSAAFQKNDDRFNHLGRICDATKSHLLKWNLSLQDESGKVLTNEGKKEMFQLAQRYQKRFPDLLAQPYTNFSFQFKFTRTQRTEASAIYFTKGLFGDEAKVWFPESLEKDPIIRFYKLCERWKIDVKNNARSKRELDAFKSSNETFAMRMRISDYLQLNNTLSYDDVNLMYVTCAFEMAWNNVSLSPWCTIFSEQDIQILEYGEDLKYYWRDGYGFPINYQQACVLSNYILDFFETGKRNSTNVMFYFTHSGTLLKLLSHLSLYKDTFSLTHDLSEPIKKMREWRVSYIDSFGSNLVFVLYRCSDGLKVLTLHQESLVHIPGCPQDRLCHLTTLRKILGAKGSCQNSKLCAVNSNFHTAKYDL